MTPRSLGLASPFGARLLAAALALAAGLSFSACGRKLPPEAPLQVLPARVEPLRVTQEASDVVLRFPYPSRATNGEELTALSGVTVLRELLPAPKGMKPPEPPSGAERERAERDFRARAQPIVKLSRADLADATYGADVVVRDSLFPLATSGQLGRVFLRYGVVASRDRGKRSSPLSPLVTLLPRVPPDRPLLLSSQVEERRVCVSWRPPMRMLDGSRPVEAGAYAVYRRAETEDAYDEPIGVTKGTEWVDEGVPAGRRFVYTVRAAPGPGTPLVLGPAADELPVDTRDVFPPPVPEGLLVLAEENDNRLVWNPVLAADLAGYRVHRKSDAGGWERVAETKAPTWVDAGAPPGAEYAVSAYDSSGNESARATVAREAEPAR